MAEDTQPWWGRAAIEIGKSKIARIMIVIFVAFEIYNAAVLPAIRGTQEALITQNRIGQSKAEECSAKFKALMDTVPMNQLGTEVSRLREECRSLTIDKPIVSNLTTEGTPLANVIKADKPAPAANPIIGSLTPEQRKAYREYLEARLDELRSDGDPKPAAIVARRVDAEAKLKALGVDAQTFDPH